MQRQLRVLKETAVELVVHRAPREDIEKADTLCRRPLLPGRSQVFPGAFSAVRTFLELWEGSQPGNVCWERI